MSLGKGGASLWPSALRAGEQGGRVRVKVSPAWHAGKRIKMLLLDCRNHRGFAVHASDNDLGGGKGLTSTGNPNNCSHMSHTAHWQIATLVVRRA